MEDDDDSKKIQAGKRRSMEPKASLLPAKRQKPLPTAPRVEEHHEEGWLQRSKKVAFSILTSVTTSPSRNRQEEKEDEQENLVDKNPPKESKDEQEEKAKKDEQKESTVNQRNESQKDGVPPDTCIEYVKDVRGKSLQEMLAYDTTDRWEEPINLTFNKNGNLSGIIDCEFDTAFWERKDDILIHKPRATGPVGQVYESLPIVPPVFPPLEEAEGPSRRRQSKRKDEKKKGSRVGPEYQAFISSRSDDTDLEDTIFADLMWDPVRAKKAQEQGQDIEGFLRKGHEAKVKFILMDSLHKSDYDTQKAMRVFIQTCRADDNVSIEVKDEQLAKFDEVFRKQARGKKNFKEASQSLGCSMETVLVQYYRWKGRCKEYARLKKQRKKEPDECKICEDGGLLLLCEHCRDAFHLECLDPPLKQAPEGDWYCNDCMKKSPAQTRKLSVGTRFFDTSSHCKLFEAPNGKTPPSIKSVSKPRRDILMAVHKELKAKPTEQRMSGKHPYSRSGVKHRTGADGTVRPAGELKRDKDGRYVKPRGPSRKGMRWSEVLGVWVPMYINRPKEDSLQQSTASHPAEEPEDNDSVMSVERDLPDSKEAVHPSPGSDDLSVDDSDEESPRKKSPQDKRKAPSSPSSNEDDDSSFHESDAPEPEDVDDDLPEAVTAKKMESTGRSQPIGAQVAPPVQRPHHTGVMPGMYNYKVPYGRGYMPPTQYYPRPLPSLPRPGQQYQSLPHPGQPRPAFPRPGQPHLGHPNRVVQTRQTYGVEQAAPSGTYFANVPITAHGLLIHIGRDLEESGVRFQGYRRLPDGGKGPAEVRNIFRNYGDEIISVDGTNITGLKWESILKLFRVIKFGPNPVIVLHVKERRHEHGSAQKGQSPGRKEVKAADRRDSTGHDSRMCSVKNQPKRSTKAHSSVITPAENDLDWLYDKFGRPDGRTVNDAGLTSFATDASIQKDLIRERVPTIEKGADAPSGTVKRASVQKDVPGQHLPSANGRSASIDQEVDSSDSLSQTLQTQPEEVQQQQAFKRASRSGSLEGNGALVGSIAQKLDSSKNIPQTRRGQSEKDVKYAPEPVSRSDTVQKTKSLDAAQPTHQAQSRQEVRISAQAAAGRQSEKDNTLSPKTREYVAKIPEALLFQVSSMNSGLRFAGYSGEMKGEKLPENGFRNVGDEIIAVDGIKCEGMTFDVAVRLLKERRKCCKTLSVTVREDQSNEQTSAAGQNAENREPESDSSDEVVILGTKPAGSKTLQTSAKQRAPTATDDSFFSPLLRGRAELNDAPTNTPARSSTTRGDTDSAEVSAKKTGEPAVDANKESTSPTEASRPISVDDGNGDAILVEARAPTGETVNLKRSQVFELRDALGSEQTSLYYCLVGIGIVTCEALLLSNTTQLARAFAEMLSEPPSQHHIDYLEARKNDILAYLRRKRSRT